MHHTNLPYAHTPACCTNFHCGVLFADKTDDGGSAAAASAADSGEEEDLETRQQAGSAGREAAGKTPVGVFHSPSELLAPLPHGHHILFSV